MKRNSVHRLLSLIMAILMFTSSVGFSADVHFCNGEFKSFSLLGEASSCHTAKKSCPHHAKMDIEDDAKKDCCSNQTFEVDDLDVDYNVSAQVELTDLQVQFVSIFVQAFFISNPPTKVQSSFLDLKVQLPSRDIYVLLERFLL